jgi:ABC-type Fe3+ transport system substrate-binding protein
VYIGPAGMLAKAPHPNAARLLMDWLTSPAGQNVHTAGGFFSPFDSSEIKYPAGTPDTKSLKLIVANPAELTTWYKDALPRFSALFGG